MAKAMKKDQIIVINLSGRNLIVALTDRFYDSVRESVLRFSQSSRRAKIIKISLGSQPAAARPWPSLPNRGIACGWRAHRPREGREVSICYPVGTRKRIESSLLDSRRERTRERIITAV